MDVSKDKKHIAILGSTGSIGTQALEVIDKLSDEFVVEVLTANNNAELLVQQALKYEPNCVIIANKDKYTYVKQALSGTFIKVYAGGESIEEVVRFKDVDIVLVALVGIAGLKPTIEAIKAKKIIALANKETMVVAGEQVSLLAQQNNVPILPVDSEHSAIFQCLQGEYHNKIARILLTCSGGTFFGKDREYLKKITPQQAMKNPNWVMGNKVTIDSASLMNKGLEVIEARWLFNVLPKDIEVVVHPQSIIHSMVEFEDGSIKAQMAPPDMHLPIMYALTYPVRAKVKEKGLDIFSIKNLSFFKPDIDTFPCLNIAYQAIEQGGNMPCCMNAANEIAVQKFLQEKISFLQIPELISKAMQETTFVKEPTLEDYFLLDRQVKEKIDKDY